MCVCACACVCVWVSVCVCVFVCPFRHSPVKYLSSRISMIHSNTAWPLLLLAAPQDMAALITASILTPSDAYTGEMLCRTELQIGWYLIIGVLIWLCGVCVGALMNLSYGTTPSGAPSQTPQSQMPTSKAKPKATFRASVSAGDSGSTADPSDVPAPDQVVSIAVPVPHHPPVLVTQHGHRYHRRRDCRGLRGAHTILRPYSACLLCANGPYTP